MPIFATLFSSISAGFAALFSAFLARDLALKSASYAAYVAVTAAFLATTYVCVNSLWSMAMGFFSGSGSIKSVSGAVAIGLGMLIPGNAATVLACCASVWSACQVYRMQRTGIIHFSH